MRQADPVEVRVPQKRFQGDGGRHFAGTDEGGHHLINAAMDGLVKMVGLQKVRNAVKGIIIDNDRAKKRLFGLKILRLQTRRDLVGTGRAGRKIFDEGHGFGIFDSDQDVADV